MIDLHSHIIPYVDDGSRRLEDSINLVKEAIELGITDIVFTPHYEITPNRVIPNVNINEAFDNFKNELQKEELNINVYLGNEVTLESGIVYQIKKKGCLTLNDSKYILLELDFFAEEEEIGEILYELGLAGYRVIIAHVERYLYADYEYVEMLANEGALIQVNALSLVSKHSYVKKFMARLLKNGLVHFVSSDIHVGRENKMSEAYQYVSKKFSKELANKLFIENPRKVLLNQDL